MRLSNAVWRLCVAISGTSGHEKPLKRTQFRLKSMSVIFDMNTNNDNHFVCLSLRVEDIFLDEILDGNSFGSAGDGIVVVVVGADAGDGK